MVSCVNCDKEFTKEDVIFECEVCEKPVCEVCKEEHAKECIKYEEESIEGCSDCGAVNDTLYACDNCGDKVCSDCQDSHSESHSDDIYTEYKYDEYVDEKVAEAL